MRSTKYCPPPPEGNYIDNLTKSFEMRCDNYAVAYTFTQFLDRLRLCDFSSIVDDFFYHKGVPVSDWVIFFSCLPKDAERMTYVIANIPYKASVIIKDEEGAVIWEQ